MYLAVEKHKIIIKYCQFKYNYHWCCKIDAIFIQQYKQNLLNFRHRFLFAFGVPSKITSFYNFTDKAPNVYKVVSAWETYQKFKKIEYSHNQVESIFISFERVLTIIFKCVGTDAPRPPTTYYFDKLPSPRPPFNVGSQLAYIHNKFQL